MLAASAFMRVATRPRDADVAPPEPPGGQNVIPVTQALLNEAVVHGPTGQPQPDRSQRNGRPVMVARLD